MQVKSNVGWLRSAFDETLTGYAVLDFLEAMAERTGYVKMPNYEVIPNREPPSTSRAMTGVSILGRRFFTQCYRIPK